MSATPMDKNYGTLPEGEALAQNIAGRRRVGIVWRWVLLACLLLGVLALCTLVFKIGDDTLGYVIIQAKVDPATLADRPLDELSRDELTAIFKENVSAGLFRRYDREKPFAERTQEDVLALVNERVVEQQIVASYNFWESLTDRTAINAELARTEGGRLEWRSWINGDFLTQPMNSIPEFSGIRNAILGTLWMIGITILIAFPIGVGAAIYLEEYAEQNWFNSLIETNINNLAGVPSIIYGMLGLAIFVRGLEHYTSGAFLGLTDTNGRTIFSASLMLARRSALSQTRSARPAMALGRPNGRQSGTMSCPMPCPVS
jgi:phosphate transport system permease protein